MAPGIVRFTKLTDALALGYQVYDRIDVGYLVRIRTVHGWEIAIVDCTPK